jgi:AcrR family transcriptional regulator
VPRAYHSPLRAEQALLTRRRILDAGRELFLDGGWAATTMKAVADGAAVAPTTVYAVFGSKRALLSALIDESITGFAETGDPDWWSEAIRHPDQAERARRLVALLSGFLPRVAPFERVVREAAGADEEVAGLARDLLEWRRAATAHLVETLAGGEGLTVSREEAADLLFVYGGPEVYSLLVDVRGWSTRQFEAHLGAQVERLIERRIPAGREDARGSAPVRRRARPRK